MDTIHALDWWVVRELALWAGDNVWSSFATVLIAEFLIVIPILTVYILWRRPEPLSHKHGNQKAALMAVLVVVFGLAFKAVLNFMLFRERPFVTHPELANLPLHVDPASFPSGHTLITFAIAFSIWHSGMHRLGKWLLFLSLLIALSRIAAGVHYPTDILGGIVVAYCASWYLHREASSIRRFLPNH
ncbi:MAG TPA: phosphatase PAP2 family protein [Verrucomicrobiae bacterium]|nr:phosphatase PAP2 family protein [Verrucomicrobiae bacterium]